jgi:CheY-like chemotaxis protein
LKDVIGFDLSFPREYLRAALVISFISVWVLVGLFYYLDRYTRRRYFNIWAAAWLFYALWLTLNISLPHSPTPPWLAFLEQWCIGVTAVFLLWGSARFLGLRVRQFQLALFMGFLLVWSYVGAFELESQLQARLPIFGLIGLASLLTSLSFYRYRRRKEFAGAGLLSAGFALWGLHLLINPFFQLSEQLVSTGFILSAVLQLFIAVSMIILVLEEVRSTNQASLERLHAQRSQINSARRQADLTEERCRALADQKLREARHLAILGRVTGATARELAGPVTAMGQVLDEIQADDALSRRFHLHLGTMQRQAERARQLMGRLEQIAGRQPDRRAPADLNAMLRKVLDARLIELRTAGLEPGADLGTGLPKVLAEPDQLREAVDGLVEAFIQRFRSDSKHRSFRVATRAISGRCSLCLEISEPGFAEELALRLEDPFRLPQPSQDTLGDAILAAVAVASELGGRLKTATPDGDVASLTLELPGIQGNPAAEAPLPAASPEVRVLVLDDDASIAAMLGEMLSLLGYRAVVQVNGINALEYVGTEAVDVILCDFFMDDMDGNEFYEELAKRHPALTTRVVFLTGDVSNPRIKEALRCTGNPPLAKPFRLDAIGSTIAGVLSRQGA